MNGCEIHPKYARLSIKKDKQQKNKSTRSHALQKVGILPFNKHVFPRNISHTNKHTALTSQDTNNKNTGIQREYIKLRPPAVLEDKENTNFVFGCFFSKYYLSRYKKSDKKLEIMIDIS